MHTAKVLVHYQDANRMWAEYRMYISHSDEERLETDTLEVLGHTFVANYTGENRFQDLMRYFLSLGYTAEEEPGPDANIYLDKDDSDCFL